MDDDMKRNIYLGVLTETMNQSLVLLKIAGWCWCGMSIYVIHILFWNSRLK